MAHAPWQLITQCIYALGQHPEVQERAFTPRLSPDACSSTANLPCTSTHVCSHPPIIHSHLQGQLSTLALRLQVHHLPTLMQHIMRIPSMARCLAALPLLLLWVWGRRPLGPLLLLLPLWLLLRFWW
jgi:hypothetical protein